MTKIVTPNYSPADEAAITAASQDGVLNADVAATLGVALGKSTRSVIAKIVRMGLPYATKAPVTKSGEPVTKKETLVSEIAAIVGSNLDGLEKAPKPALYALRQWALAQVG